jgi:formylglycine-generating enzyme required for sulfatase activity
VRGSVQRRRSGGRSIFRKVQGGRFNHRVLRGGSWYNNGRNCRTAYRNRNEPGNRNNNIGFRVALVSP